MSNPLSSPGQVAAKVHFLDIDSQFEGSSLQLLGLPSELWADLTPGCPSFPPHDRPAQDLVSQHGVQLSPALFETGLR